MTEKTKNAPGGDVAASLPTEGVQPTPTEQEEIVMTHSNPTLAEIIGDGTPNTRNVSPLADALTLLCAPSPFDLLDERIVELYDKWLKGTATSAELDEFDGIFDIADEVDPIDGEAQE